MAELTKKNVEEKIKELAKSYRVRVYFSKKCSDRGVARFWRRSITINTNLNPIEKMSTFFHELGHIYCYDQGLWVNYHNDKPIEQLTDKEKRLIIRTAVRAEKWIDKWAEVEMKKSYPNLNYFTTYTERATIRQFKIDIKKELCVN